MGTVLFVANWDWVIFNFRLHLARALAEEGYNVSFVCPNGDYVQELRSFGFEWIEWQLSRRSINPAKELKAIEQLARIYAERQPDIVHHDTIKPNIYGPIAVRRAERKYRVDLNLQMVCSYMGLGYLFSRSARARMLRVLVDPLLRRLVHDDRVYMTFSNEADRELFQRFGFSSPIRSEVLVSEFVDTTTYFPGPPKKPGPAIVLMASRLLWDKGVGEFVEASRLLSSSGKEVEFWIAGIPDKGAPGYVPEHKLRAWEAEGLIRWLGHRSDMPSLLRQVDVAALPTHYNEGMPRFLVEAAASGLPLVSSDIEACRLVVRDGFNGYCVRKKDPGSLADSIIKLIDNDSLRRQMGIASRKLASQEFEKKVQLQNWLRLYRKLSRKSASTNRVRVVNL